MPVSNPRIAVLFSTVLSIALFGGVFALAQKGFVPQPGNPGHVEPPKDWVCTNPGRGVPADHACECNHSCVKAQICDDDGCVDDPAGGMTVKENAKCKSWCYPRHCGCKISGCEST